MAWSPFSMQKKGYNMVVKKPYDHCVIKIKITIPCISANNKKKPLINFRNPEGWQKYKIISDVYSPRMKELVEKLSDFGEGDCVCDCDCDCSGGKTKTNPSS